MLILEFYLLTGFLINIRSTCKLKCKLNMLTNESVIQDYRYLHVLAHSLIFCSSSCFMSQTATHGSGKLIDATLSTLESPNDVTA